MVVKMKKNKANQLSKIEDELMETDELIELSEKVPEQGEAENEDVLSVAGLDEKISEDDELIDLSEKIDEGNEDLEIGLDDDTTDDELIDLSDKVSEEPSGKAD